MSDASLSPFNSSISSCSSPSDPPSPSTVVQPEDLPFPTAPRPFPTKKSHARKRPLGHIPRPRNAFILFRCDYGRQNQRKLQDHDQNEVSRMVGNIWRNMTEDQKAPWLVLAEAEKKKHAALHPGYKYIPRNRKSKPTKETVDKQLMREAEKAVEAEFVARVKEENSKNMVMVYYPPWATRRTLTYFARRASSCPPPDAIGIEPYSEVVHRAMVTTSAPPASKKMEEKTDDAEKQSRSPPTDLFVPSTYGINDTDCLSPHEVSPSWRITADRMLSQCLYTIDPPGGTSSWGQTSASESSALYVFEQQPEQFDLPPFIYTPEEELESAMPRTGFLSSEGYAAEKGWSPEIPALLPPSPSDSSPSPSPVTPTECSTFTQTIGVQSTKSTEPSLSFENAQDQSYREFLSEFGNMSQPLGDYGWDEETSGIGTRENLFPAPKSSERSTYAVSEVGPQSSDK
ncbi:hypothetical protein B0H11DRAFT_1152912 [Mycena galericulata]|nr:hypothetical protein B0H11DRAFT_1152912 [Mycena galericulata]